MQNDGEAINYWNQPDDVRARSWNFKLVLKEELEEGKKWNEIFSRYIFDE